MPESRWNDHEGRFEIDRERGFDEDLGYGYDASPRRDQGGPAPAPAGRRPRRGSAELRRAVSQGGDIGYGQAPGIGGGYGARGPGDYGRVGGHDFGAATGDYGGGYRGRTPDYGDRRYFEHERDQHRPYGEQRYDGAARGEDRSWVDRARDEVSAWMGDHDAQHRREADAAIHRGRGPKGYRRSDERIRDDVNDRLTDDAWLDASHVEVAVENGDVTLSGTVADRPAKRRAELLAEAVSGVGNVQNNLRVDVAGEAGREAGLGGGGTVPPIRDPLG